jgi:uncharacterized RDD family membrane protein YckC
VADRRFCSWCEAYVANPDSGKKAGVGRRFLATILDGVVFSVLFLVITAVFAAMMDPGGVIAILFFSWLAYAAVLLWFLSQGLTPGKMLVGERVVEHLRGGPPGIGKMFVREVFGKFVSGLVFGLGYFWAIWDRDGQAWHDKIAGTVVVRRS